MEVVERLLAAVEELLEVLVEVLEDEREFAVGVEHVDEADDVGVLELLEQGDLADGRRRDALVLRLQPDLLQRVDLVCISVTRLVDDTISTFANDLNFFVLINFRLHVSLCLLR